MSFPIITGIALIASILILALGAHIDVTRRFTYSDWRKLYHQ